MARKKNTEISIEKHKYLSDLAEKAEKEKVGLYFVGDLFKSQYKLDDDDDALVQQPKEFISSIYRLSPFEAKILEFLFFKFQESGFPNKITFDMAEYSRRIGFKPNVKHYYDMIVAIDRLSRMQLCLRRQNEDKTKTSLLIINFFGRMKIDTNLLNEEHYRQDIECSLTPEMATIIKSSLKKNFALIPFHTIRCIQSSYALRYYKIALMYMYNKGRMLVQNNKDAKKIMKFAQENNIDLPQSWLFTFSPNELRLNFCLDENEYRDEKTGGNSKYFAENLVKKPILDLNKSVDDLQITVQTVYNGKNRASGVKYWVFWCTSIDTTRFWLCPKCRKKNEISHTRCSCNYDREKGRRMTQAELDEENEELKKNFERISLRFASEK